MRLVSISNIPDGAPLGRDVLAGSLDAAPLLRAGVKLDAHYREGLRRAGIHAVYIEDASSEGIIPPEPLISQETQQLAARTITDAWARASDALAAGGELPPETAEALGTVVEQMLHEIKRSGGLSLALADLAAADAYTFQHSIDVTALGLLIGSRIFRDHGWGEQIMTSGHSQIDERLLLLGMGLLVHDIGKLAIPEKILKKQGSLTLEEAVIMRTHPQLGFDLMKGNVWSPLVKSVVLRHHERWDGSGYPDGKVRTEIHQMARIAAVADVYDAITSERVYARARPAHEGVRAIRDGHGTLFDPEVVEAFLALVAPFPVGIDVKLQDGRRGIVVSVPEHTPDRPTVRVLDGPEAPFELSLVRNPTVRIDGWDPFAQAVAA